MINEVLIRQANYENLAETVGEILDRCNFLVSDQDFVVIKPNLCDLRPSWEGCTTDLSLIVAVIDKIREQASPRIAIIESNHWVADAETEFERLGFAELAREKGVELLNISHQEKERIKIQGQYFEYFLAAKPLLEMTKFISVPKLKTHSQHKVTLAMKNQFGLITATLKKRHHPFMEDVLLDLSEIFKPDIIIVDGIVGMEGAGPSDGMKVNSGVLIGGTDYFAVDSAATKFMGFNPKKVPALKNAHKKMGYSFKEIEIDSNVSKRKKFRFVPFLTYRIQRLTFWMQRRAINFDGKVAALAEFMREGSMGLMVLLKGRYIASDQGIILRPMVWRYGRGLMRRPFVSLSFRPLWQKMAFWGLFMILLISVSFFGLKSLSLI
ncbi:MAG: DUF362 domain-containing protein [Candidatus Heimdallarchaeota archaeon]